MSIVYLLIYEVIALSLTERIKMLAEPLGSNFSSIEKKLGFGNGTIRRWDNNAPAADKLLDVANLLNTTTDFLLTGKNTNLINPNDAEWLSLIHKLPKEAQLEFKGELKGYIRHMEESVAAEERQGKSLA